MRTCIMHRRGRRNRVELNALYERGSCPLGMKKFEYKGKQWHEQCFCCKVCLQPIGNKSFIPRDQEVVCVACYEEQYAQRCLKCNGVSWNESSRSSALAIRHQQSVFICILKHIKYVYKLYISYAYYIIEVVLRCINYIYHYTYYRSCVKVH